MVFQVFVQIDFFGGHRLGLDDQPRTALLGQRQHEVGDFGPIVAENHLPASRFDVSLKLLEVVVQVVDRMPLEEVSVGAQLLVIRQHVGSDDREATVL